MIDAPQPAELEQPPPPGHPTSASAAGLVGVLALQGDFVAHEEALAAIGHSTRRVRRPRDLEGLDGIVLPGGESSTMLRLLDLQSLAEPLRDAIAGGLPTFATCAGMILLAREVTGPEQDSLGLLDLSVRRNGYGRQVHSGTFDLDGSCEELPKRFSGVFIRAPRIERVGDVEVLARRGEDAVLVRSGSILAACFHPELQAHHRVVRMFSASCSRSAR